MKKRNCNKIDVFDRAGYMNGLLVTKAKIKRAESAKLKVRASNKLHRRLTVMCSEMPASF